ncbi:hypothetical protein PENSUB_8508 [Penicillium subrubescens]|uniref:F-box domain-containing protein n=2 Tax=Penicillium subrubescens TaxID=1316194 RepID=A0A1Q5TFX8_9EURO|nr:hypothetical protein PENSUB_8508 [Penicillium subrubescens]
MDIISEDQALLRQYQDLPKSSRQAILRGILDQLPRDGWREIKAQADVHTFQYDILGKLPLELAALVAECLPLVDIIRLRRVSQRWQQVLSSPSLCRAAARATLGKDPWALSSSEPQLDTRAPGTLTSAPTVSPDTMVTASTPNSGHDFTSYSTASFTKIVKRRHRLEQGNPYKVTTMPFPLPIEDTQNHSELDLDPRTFVTYSDSSCAWLDPKENLTTVVVLDLVNENRKKFTTDNREKLCSLQFAKPFIAAVSIRGYCHVWNIDTFEFSSFRIPSIDFLNMLISGTKVLVQFHHCVVHWCFKTRIARTMETGSVIALALHPSEDQITTVCLCAKDEKQNWSKVPIQDCQLRIEKHALDSRHEWCLLSWRYQPISVSAFPEQATYFAGILDSGGTLYSGQSNMVMYTREEIEKDFIESSRLFCLSIEPDERVVFHTFPTDVHDLTCPERGVIYAPRVSTYSSQYVIMKSKAMTDPENLSIWYDYYIHRTIEAEYTPWIMGDARFLIVFDDEQMNVGTMDEPDLEDREAVDRVNELIF